MKRRIAIAACALALPGAAFAQTAPVYRYTDPDGRVIYTDRPPPTDAKNLQTKRVGGNFIENSEPGYQAQLAAERFPVTLYTFDCGDVCRNAEALLNKRGVPFTIVRPFNVYGPGMQKLDYRVLPNFAAKILEGEAVTVYGTGEQTRTFCYVTDAITGFLKVLLHGEPGEPYNIGNPSPEISMLKLVETIRDELPHLNVQHHVAEHPDTYPADEPLRRCPDITKARTQVGYEPKIPLDEGLKRFFGWAQDAYR